MSPIGMTGDAYCSRENNGCRVGLAGSAQSILLSTVVGKYLAHTEVYVYCALGDYVSPLELLVRALEKGSKQHAMAHVREKPGSYHLHAGISRQSCACSKLCIQARQGFLKHFETV